MVMKKRVPVRFEDVFPVGAYLKQGENGPVEPVLDFNAEKRADGSRPQQLDKDTGLLLWQATVLDADDAAGKKDTAVSVKFASKVQPVPPENKSGFPWTPVEFVGLTALAYVDENGSRPRIAWSFRAEDMIEPSNGNGASSNGTTKASSTSTTVSGVASGKGAS